MKLFPIADCHCFWYVAPALLLVYLILPDRVYDDVAMDRLADTPGQKRNAIIWKQAQMHELSDIGMAPVAGRQQSTAILSGGIKGNAESTYRSFIPSQSAPQDSYVPPMRIAAEPARSDSGLFSLSEKLDSPQIGSRRQGWLTRGVLAAESGVDSLSRPIFPGLPDASDMDVFGEDGGVFDRPGNSFFKFGSGLFEEKEPGDGYLFLGPGILGGDEKAPSGSTLFHVEESPQL